MRKSKKIMKIRYEVTQNQFLIRIIMGTLLESQLLLVNQSKRIHSMQWMGKWMKDQLETD